MKSGPMVEEMHAWTHQERVFLDTKTQKVVDEVKRSGNVNGYGNVKEKMELMKNLIASIKKCNGDLPDLFDQIAMTSLDSRQPSAALAAERLVEMTIMIHAALESLGDSRRNRHVTAMVQNATKITDLIRRAMTNIKNDELKDKKEPHITKMIALESGWVPGLQLMVARKNCTPYEKSDAVQCPGCGNLTLVKVTSDNFVREENVRRNEKFAIQVLVHCKILGVMCIVEVFIFFYFCLYTGS